MITVALVDAITQLAGAPSVQLEIGKLMLAIIALAFSALGTAVIWFIQRLIKSFDGFKTESRGKFEKLSKELVQHGEQVDARIEQVRGELSAHSRHVGTQLGALSQQMQKVTQETFGPNGDNGMRGDVRESKKLLAKHDRILVRLADRNGIPYDEES